jgi:LPS-assembly protein
MNSETPHLPCRLKPVACGVACALAGLLHGLAWGQAAPDSSGLKLRQSPMLQEAMPGTSRREGPVFLSGERLSGHTDQETVIEGAAELRRGDTVIRADRLEYNAPDDMARANGHVQINRAGNVYRGQMLELEVEAFKGFFTEPTIDFLKNKGHGEASRADFVDDKHAIIHNASYTTCRRSGGPEWLPDWVLQATRIHIDNEEEVGQAEGAVLRFKDVPILPIPGISFPLGNQRKSGLLSPTIALGSVNGLEVVAPYYLNLAPNRDATVTPTLMSRRGVDLAGEYRYLMGSYNGLLRGNFMPSDALRDRSRWGISAQHNSNLPGNLGLSLNLNRVSDDNYWRDFTRVSTSLTTRLLPNDANLTWSEGPFSARARALKWQTLQDASAPIVPPYDRLPQLTGRYTAPRLAGIESSVDLDYTRFESDALRTGQPNAHRSFALAQVSRPWVQPGGFITPKLQLHATNYVFDAPLSDGATRASRVLPTFSLDSGLVLERDTSYFGRAFRQTLEPRAFYVYTPFRDQSTLPNYDSGANDFNFATIYSENAFVGNDRIADNNLLTLGVTTRLLDPVTGGEAARFGIAQRLRFSDQQVALPGVTPASERLSDLLLGATVNWDPRWSLDSTLQFNPKTGRSIRTTMGGRYSPGNYRVVSAAYRLQNGSSEQLDLGWQWPINDLWGDKGQNLGAGQGQGPGRWYSVGRLNYSLQDRRLVDVIAGIEYDAGCWLGRAVLERLQSGVTTATSRIMLQLEFVGFSHIGSSPLKTLRDNIPRYQYLRDQTTEPSRFSNYD